MANVSVEVFGWRKNDGPVYTVTTRRHGWRNRRNRFSAEHFGKRGGRYFTGKDSRQVEHDGVTYLLFNKGHEYHIILSAYDREISGLVDAREEFVVMPLDDVLTLVEVLE